MWSVGVTAVMVAVECLEVGSSTLNKAAMNKGTSDFVLIVYSNAFAAIFILLPSTFIYYRNRTRPPLTVSIICKIFGLGLISCCVQTCLYVGIGYSSPTLSSAIVDLTPAFTFILALISRMEKLDLRVQSSLAKSIGTMVSIAGALTVTLYKGPALVSMSSSSNLHNELRSPQKNWIIGGLVLAASSFFLSLLYIVQTSIIREYPEELMATFICCVFVTIQSTVVALIAERNPNSWRLKPDTELIAIGCSAFFAVALRSLAHTWACHKKGPVYVSMYKPLGIVFAIIMGVTLLGDTLYLGRMEKLELRVQSSQAKSFGTVLLIGGALIVTLYKGLPITSAPSKNKLINQLVQLPLSNWTIGGIFLAAHSVILAIYYIVQAWIVRDYPAELMVTLICSIFVTILSSAVSLVAEKNPNAWRLRPDIELMAIGYSAIFAVSVRSVFHTWALRKKGPVYVSMFKPLGMVVALVFGIAFLGDTLYLGSFVGAATIALGFYAVIWGQAKEEKMDEDNTEISGFKPSSPCVPLLINKSNTEDSRATFASG